MKITIKNGVTIINTGDAVGGLKNKTGHVGISYLEKEELYIARIHIKKKYYQLGRFKEIEDAIAMRAEADRQKAAGTLLDWIATIPKKPRGRKPKKLN